MPKSLESLYLEIKDCQKCRLAQSRTHLVFGVGSEKAELMFVGEAPGYYEDQQGEPFVGAAGQLLDRLLASIGFSREEVYIGNVLKCRPPNNRDPLQEEVETCKPYLFKQIEIISPKIVATLGLHATRLLLNKSVSMSQVHGKKLEGKGYYIFPIYHPAAALYNRTTLTSLEKDFQILKTIFDQGITPLKEAEQMELF